MHVDCCQSSQIKVQFLSTADIKGSEETKQEEANLGMMLTRRVLILLILSDGVSLNTPSIRKI